MSGGFRKSDVTCRDNRQDNQLKLKSKYVIEKCLKNYKIIIADNYAYLSLRKNYE